MRKANVFRPEAALPRMSWSAANLYNLIARSTTPILKGQTSFVGSTTTATMYQQRWRAKRMIRGYHGDYIPEKRFKRWFLPSDLPSFHDPAASGSKVPRVGGMFQGGRQSARERGDDMPDPEEKLPIASLFVREVERRLDTAVFRSCFATSIYEARAMVIHGKVMLNGTKFTDPGHLLEPADLISVDAKSVPMLAKAARRAETNKKKREEKFAKRRKQGALESDKRLTEAASEMSKEEGTESAALEGTSPESQEATKVEESTSEGSEDKVEESTSEGPEDEVEESTSEGPENKVEESATEGSKDKVEASKTEGSKDKASADRKIQRKEQLPRGVLRFELPKFAAPHLFIPPYLEVSFTTCSAIYLRHPTLIAPSRLSKSGTTDIPSPYSATGELWNLAWEYYAKNAPRVRGEARRIKKEAKHGRSGFKTSRAKDEWKKLIAIRRGWLKVMGNKEKNIAKGGNGTLRLGIIGAGGSGEKMRKRRKAFRIMKSGKSKRMLKSGKSKKK